jgi:hypothetical protein
MLRFEHPEHSSGSEPSSVEYSSLPMTPELMERILQEFRERGWLSEETELAANDPLPEGMESVIGEFLPEQQRQAEPHQVVDTHPWFDQGQMTQEMLDTAMSHVIEQQMAPEPAPPEAMAEEFMSMQDGYDDPVLQGLEAVVQDAMPQLEPLQMQEDPYEQQRLMYDQQMQQMLNPFMMPGFGPGP